MFDKFTTKKYIQLMNLSDQAAQIIEVERGFRISFIKTSSRIIGGLTLMAILLRVATTEIKPLNVFGAGSMALGLLIISFLIERSRWLQRFGNYIALGLIAFMIVIAGFTNGGVMAPVITTLILLPALGFLGSGRRGGIFGLTIALLSLALVFGGQQWALPLDSPEKYIYYKTVIQATSIVGTFFIAGVYERIRKSSEKRIYELSSKMLYSAKMVSLGEMSAGVAHEVNNPLTIIKARVELLSRSLVAGKITQEQVLENLDKINSTVDRAAKIISALRSYSRTDSRAQSVRTPISEILQSVLDISHERFRASGIDLRVKGDTTIAIDCRPTEIMHILLNLLGNSYDAIETLPEKWISVEVGPHGRDVAVSITDSGAGIDEKTRKGLMQPFFTTKPIGKGTGLGLSVSKGFAESHGGTLKYDATSTNTRFVLVLPVETA